MAENILMNFLIKRAYTPWVNNELPEITNSDSWENFSYDPDVLANHEYNSALNALKRSLGPEAWNKFVNDVNYRYRGQPNEYELKNFLKAYNIQNSGPVVQDSNKLVVSPESLPQVTVNPFEAADNILSQYRPETQSEETVSNSVPTSAPDAIPGTASVPTAVPEPTPAPATVPAVTSPALPSSALTAAGGANVSFQTPTVNIPEFNSAPKTAPAPAPSAQATQNPFYDPKSITRQQMRQYRRYTGATNMNSDMDRWKTYQAMNGNRNASNADYYSAKRNNSLGAVKNPITQPK